MISESAVFSACLLGGAVGGFTALSVVVSAFFSGSPNRAARFANVSSDTPIGALSIAPALGFGSAFVVASVSFVAKAGAAVEDGLVFLEALELVGFGLKGTPNRSARAFMACCSGVNVGAEVSEVVGSEVDVCA